MKTWNVTITETLARTVTVKADDAAGSEGIVRGMHGRGEIALAAKDMRSTEITTDREGICPLCGASIEYSGENHIDDEGGTFPWTCPGCGAHGREGYSRRFSGHWDVDAGKTMPYEAGKELDAHAQTYLEAKENGGNSFPDFIGALVMDELACCTELAAAYWTMKEEHQARAKEDEKAFCEEKNNIAEHAISEAIRIIREGGELKNDKVTFYRSKYDVSSHSIVLYLMRKYDIDIPLRTQGWINEKLIDIIIKEGRCVNVHYWRSKRGSCSEKFIACMNELIHTVTAQGEKS